MVKDSDLTTVWQGLFHGAMLDLDFSGAAGTAGDPIQKGQEDKSGARRLLRNDTLIPVSRQVPLAWPEPAASRRRLQVAPANPVYQ